MIRFLKKKLVSSNLPVSKPQKAVCILKSNQNSGANQEINVIRDLLIGRYDSNITGNLSLTKSEAIRYYKICSPVFTAIDIVSKEIGNIKPELWNTDENKWDNNSFDVINLLKHPNGTTSWHKFITTVFSFFTITGDAYILASGNVNKPPKSLIVINPQNVILMPSYQSRNNNQRTLPYPSQINIDCSWGSYEFFPSFKMLDDTGQIRYQDKTGFFELFRISNFNPENDSDLEGMSPLNAVYYEIQQYLDSSKHNISLLQRGISSEYIITLKGLLDQEALDSFREQLDSENTGTNNAGRPLIFSGDDIDVHQISKSNKDMEFELAQKRVALSIYSALHIPLPMISGDHMSLANYEASRLVLYDQAVLPVATHLFTELTNFLMPRYEKDNLVISFNQRNIPALESRKIEQVKAMRDSGVFSPDEIRGFFGAERVGGGAAMIYMISNMIPISSDKAENNDDFDVPSIDETPHGEVPTQTDAADKATKHNVNLERFKAILSTRKDGKGNDLFSDAKIEQMAAEMGLK